jgi:hypothetical protein
MTLKIKREEKTVDDEIRIISVNFTKGQPVGLRGIGLGGASNEPPPDPKAYYMTVQYQYINGGSDIVGKGGFSKVVSLDKVPSNPIKYAYDTMKERPDYKEAKDA